MKAAAPSYLGLVLAVHPTSHGFGWVLFEGPLSPVDWGMASAKPGRNARLMKRFERLLNRYEPAVFVLESFEGRDATRVDRIRRLCRSMQNLVACRDISIRIYSRAAVRTCFATIGATSRYEIALAIAQRIDAFNHRLPPKRRKWMNQDPRQSLFDAAALAITYFAFSGAP
ncbi:MAG TPA: hypothetical protein VGT78_01200 [Rhizomicrobium sp.]|nr:hypothetical protein [Rhizomicrobium sp.]